VLKRGIREHQHGRRERNDEPGNRTRKVGDWIRSEIRTRGKSSIRLGATCRFGRAIAALSMCQNRTIAEESIKNFSSARGRGIKIVEVIRLDPEMDPPVVTELIHKAIKKTHAVLEDPPPTVYFRGMKKGRAEYVFGYFIDDYGPQPARSDVLWRVIAEALPEWRDERLHWADPE
jgi:small-conductance mechanosensitive channel